MRRAALLVVAAVLVNLPWVHGAWQHHRISGQGHLVTAPVTGRAPRSDLVRFRLPRAVDPARSTFAARLDPEHFARASRTGSVRVRVVPGDPAANEVVGESDGILPTVLAAVGDSILVLLALGWWWRRAQAAPERVGRRSRSSRP